MRYLEGSNGRSQGLGEAEGDLVSNGHRASVWDNERVLGTDDGDGYPTT